MRVFVLILCGIMLPWVARGASSGAGDCDYEKHQIKVEITSIKELSSSKSPKYEIRFVVLITEELPVMIENRVYGRDYQMLLRNKTFPGPEFLRKYKIAEGSQFDSVFNLRTRGHCRSSFFEFPDIKLNDYSESQP